MRPSPWPLGCSAPLGPAQLPVLLGAGEEPPWGLWSHLRFSSFVPRPAESPGEELKIKHGRAAGAANTSLAPLLLGSRWEKPLQVGREQHPLGAECHRPCRRATGPEPHGATGLQHVPVPQQAAGSPSQRSSAGWARGWSRWLRGDQQTHTPSLKSSSDQTPLWVLSPSPPRHVEHPQTHPGHPRWCHHHGVRGWRGRDSPCSGQQALAGELLIAVISP